MKHYTIKRELINIEENNLKLQEILKQDEEDRQRRKLKTKEKSMKFKEVHELPGYSKEKYLFAEKELPNNKYEQKITNSNIIMDTRNLSIDDEDNSDNGSLKVHSRVKSEKEILDEETTFRRVFGSNEKVQLNGVYNDKEDRIYKGNKEDNLYNVEDDFNHKDNGIKLTLDTEIYNECNKLISSKSTNKIENNINLNDNMIIQPIDLSQNESNLINKHSNTINQLNQINKISHSSELNLLANKVDDVHSLSEIAEKPIKDEKKKLLSKYLLYKRPIISDSKVNEANADLYTYQNKPIILNKSKTETLNINNFNISTKPCKPENQVKTYSKIHLDFINNKKEQREDKNTKKTITIKITYLEEFEKECMYLLMGYIIKSKSNTHREVPLFSVEYFFGKSFT